MNQEKRFHPLLILHDIWSLIKSSIVFFLFLFVIQGNSEFWLYEYGRSALIVLFILILLYIPVRWSTSWYKFGKKSLQLQRKLFSTNSRTIPYTKVQHARRKSTLFHRIFNMTSLTLETSTTGDISSVTFHVLTPEEAEKIEKHIRGNVDDTVVPYEKDQPGKAIEHVETEERKGNYAGYRLNFTPTRHDMMKASLTSFSFIAVIPIVWSLISNLEQVFLIEGHTEGILTNILNAWSWWMIMIFLILLTLAAVAAGVFRTVLRYGKYEIASDFDNIYITKGVLEQTSFTITKANVQAISVHQSLMKRILGLAEVKLLCAGGTGAEDVEVSTLYPFLPVQRAYAMIQEILPAYQVTPTMERLPEKAFWLRMLRPSWFWMIVTVFLFYFQPEFFGIRMPWWIVSTVIMVLVIMSRLLSFVQARYTINGEFVQFKTGGFNTKLFLSKRNKIVELQLTRNIVQQKLGLVSIVTSNRAKPVKRTRMNDIPVEWSRDFRSWYMLGSR